MSIQKYELYFLKGGKMFSERLEEALKNKNMTGNALCNAMKIENRNYTNWKNNKIPRAETLKEIAYILEVSTDWLLEKDNSTTPEETKLINNYRLADERGKENITNIAEYEAKRCKNTTKLKPFA